ncbi:hypothetical protein OTU49_011956 [Cherax quadricarinatus]|uniref:Uncharacterized protein n=1 Tax=Cherax quadricarinatus TaxID=27406 RepID=A0AAW0W174_CHEQU
MPPLPKTRSLPGIHFHFASQYSGGKINSNFFLKINILSLNSSYCLSTKFYQTANTCRLGLFNQACNQRLPGIWTPTQQPYKTFKIIICQVYAGNTFCVCNL